MATGGAEGKPPKRLACLCPLSTLTWPEVWPDYEFHWGWKQVLDIDAQIREYLNSTSEPLTATEVLQEADQKPAVLAPSRRRSAPGWLIAVAAAIIVLLLGLITLLLPDDDQSPATNSTLPVTTTQPETVDSTPNSSQSSLSFEWTEVEGPNGSLPPSGFTWSPTDGYVGVDGGGGLNRPTESGIQYRWTSVDGLGWDQESGPVPNPPLSADGLTEFLSSLVADPGDIRLNPAAVFDPIQSTEGVIIDVVHLRLKVPWHEWYEWDGEGEWEESLVTWDSESETITLTRSDGTTAAVLAVQEDRDTASIIDVGSNEVKGVLRGSDDLPLDRLIAAARHGQLRLGAYLRSEDGATWSFHLSPWPEEDFFWGLPINPTQSGGFTATVSNDAEGSVSTWMSNDGISWVRQGSLEFLDSIDSYLDVHVYPFAGRLRADVLLDDPTEGYGETVSWESSNGLDWTPSSEDFGNAPHVDTDQTNFGWVASTWLYEGGSALWISSDGRTWNRIETPASYQNRRLDGLWQAGGAGDVAYLSITTGTTTYLWIGKPIR